jgi:hypothetical protein
MTQARRDSPRIPYDEAICLARIDGEGRLYGRGLDLSASGVSLVSTESSPVGTEIKFDVLLPHGPRSVTGTIVRVTATPSGFELAVAFGEIKPAVAAMIATLIAARADDVPQAAPDVALDDVQRARTKRYGTPKAEAPRTPPAPSRLPPINLPPPCGHPLPSVVVATVLSGDEPALEAPPPRRRVPGTAAIMRRADPASWALRPAAVMATVAPRASAIPTERLTTLQMTEWWPRARWVTVPVVAALTVAIVQLGLHLHFSH